jgi:hypothetical protein
MSIVTSQEDVRIFVTSGKEEDFDGLQWLRWSQTNEFRSSPLSHHIYKKWKSLPMIEKLPYLIDRNFLWNARVDFQDLCSLAYSFHAMVDDSLTNKLPKPIETTASIDPDNKTTKMSDNTTRVNCDSQLDLPFFLGHLDSFTAASDVKYFFQTCDSIFTGRSDNFIDWVEYVLCRGLFDRNGKPFDTSEFDFLENIVVSDYQALLNDPHNPMVLDLIAKGEDL